MRRPLVLISVLGLVLVAAFTFLPEPHAQSPKRLSFAVAFTQKDAPIHIQAVTHTMDFLYGSAKVQNASDQTIRSVTFGVLFHETGPDWTKPILASSREIATNLKPGEVRSVDVEDLSIRDAQQKPSEMRSNPVVVEFGVLGTQFADGTSWSYDWRAQGAFEPENMWRGGKESLSVSPTCTNPSEGSLFARLARMLPGISRVLAQSGYTCGTSAVSQSCKNDITSCTDTLCPKRQTLPSSTMQSVLIVLDPCGNQACLNLGCSCARSPVV